MNVVALFDPDCNVPAQVSMALLLARGQAEQVLLLVALKDIEQVRAKALAQIRNAAGQADGFHFVAEREPAPKGGAADAAGAEASAEAAAPTIPVRCEFLDPTQPTAALRAKVRHDVTADLLILMLNRCDPRDEWANRIGQELVPLVPCRIAVVRMVAELPAKFERVVVPAGETHRARGALKLARQLAPEPGAVQAVFVEPPIGADAESVGGRELDRVLIAALGDEHTKVARRVVVDENRQSGVAAAVKDSGAQLLVVGTSSNRVLDNRFHGTMSSRICRQLADVPVIVVREGLPAGHRLRSHCEALLQRFVPQLDRTTRVDFTQRVQSNSSWNFDFVALISLASMIAAMGLLQNSAAVIIGAMLVAPLMTPIMGLGLALVQGNTMLARLALRTIALGVGTAFVLALTIGLCKGHFSITPEMIGRGWPGVLDLIVAFVSGLAAAYASSRPGLFAALPGVAIAASLVPPIATSGLAAARGELQLSYGAFLLFFTNMVAIVLAASFSLWAVGVRNNKGGVRWLRWLGNGFIVLSLALAVHLNSRGHVGGELDLTDDCHAAVDGSLPAGARLVDVHAIERGDHVEVTLRLGASAPPPAALVDDLAQRIARQIGRDLQLRLVHEWEARGAAAVGR
ncbi:MAG: DUF389 domain-containing protein [Planctomycetes bacterium]|nr:DUF389 domain-containing protein [Planctomycetota bacterium]